MSATAAAIPPPEENPPTEVRPWRPATHAATSCACSWATG